MDKRIRMDHDGHGLRLADVIVVLCGEDAMARAEITVVPYTREG